MTPHLLNELADQAQRLPDTYNNDIASEPGAKYHAFLHLLVKSIEAKRIVELGTYIGESTKYMSLGAPMAHILTTDIDSNARNYFAGVWPQVTAVTDNALTYAQAYDKVPIDLLFIDVNHDFSLTHSCYEAWKGFVRPGGLICVDDIHLDRETERFNQYLQDNGVAMIDIPDIHATGFGVIIV